MVSASRGPGHIGIEPARHAFGWRIAIRLGAIGVLLATTVWFAFSPYWLTAFWTGLASAGLFYQALRIVNRSELRMAAFLQSIRQGDFTLSFTPRDSSENNDLQYEFTQLTEIFKKLRSERESHHQLLKAVVADATVSLVCFNEQNDEVFLINEAACKLFGIAFLQNIGALARVDPELPEFLRKLMNGGKEPLRIVLHNRVVNLSISSRQLLFEGKSLKLVILTDVSSELAARDAEAWHKLIRVLTHEISNSAIPLSTLSSLVHEIISKAEQDHRELSTEERADILEGLTTIDKRSRSLKNFVSNFRSINAMPEPNPVPVSLSDLVGEARILLAKEVENNRVSWQEDVPQGIIVLADKDLTMNAIINLFKNAIEAMDGTTSQKEIRLSFSRSARDYCELHVADTGCGIDPQTVDQIFVPFYSTKKNGSGIGLSIAHQVMQKQRGDLSVSSVPGKGSVFTMSFRLAEEPAPSLAAYQT